MVARLVRVGRYALEYMRVCLCEGIGDLINDTPSVIVIVYGKVRIEVQNKPVEVELKGSSEVKWGLKPGRNDHPTLPFHGAKTGANESWKANANAKARAMLELKLEAVKLITWPSFIDIYDFMNIHREWLIGINIESVCINIYINIYVSIKSPVAPSFTIKIKMKWQGRLH